MATIDEVYANILPYDGKPRLRDKKQLQKFVESLDLQRGKLYSLARPTAWIYGNINDPLWVGDRDKQGEYVFTTEEGDHVIYLDHVYINWIDSYDKRAYWISTLQFLVKDKTAYIPIAPGIVNDSFLKQEFLKMFIPVKID